MRYCDLLGAFDVYAKGGNVTKYLRDTLGEEENNDSIIEIAYDLQAGSYIEQFEKNRDIVTRYIDEISNVVKTCIGGARSVIDVGTGECTTLAGVSASCFDGVESVLGCDISWSRLYTGLNFVHRELSEASARKLSVFVCSLFTLPLASKSVDVVWTSHAIEPNGGREHEALAEIFRIARSRVCLFEPYYEENSEEGQQRMDRLGYIRGLRRAIKDLGGKLEDCIRIEHAINPLNPTYAFIIIPPPIAGVDHPVQGCDVWVCPSTGYPMSLFEGFMYCERSGLAYPILRGIPVLRKESAILATALRQQPNRSTTTP